MSMFSAMAEILAVVKVVDQASAPLGRVSNAAKTASGVIRGLADTVVGMSGAKGLYDWTVKSAQNYQMMQLGLGAIIQMHSKLAASSAQGMSAADQMQAKYNAGLQIGHEMMDRLQAKALSGVGTFQDYGQMFQQLSPTLIGVMGKNAFTEGGQEKMANFINMAQHFKAIMMSGYGDGKRANDLTSRELAMLMNGNARSNEPVFRNLFPEYLGNIKKFNEMAPTKKFDMLVARLNQFAVVSGDISKTWAAISTTIVDIFQMIGRGIGAPIMKGLSDLALKIPLLHDALGLLNPGENAKSSKDQHAASERQKHAYKSIIAFGNSIGEQIIGPFKTVANFLIPAISHHWGLILTATKAAAGMIAVVLAAAAASKAREMAGSVGGAAMGVLGGVSNLMGTAGLALMNMNRGLVLTKVGAMLAGAATGSLGTRLLLASGTIVAVIGGIWLLISTFKHAINTSLEASIVWEGLKQRIGEVVSMITGRFYPAGTGLSKMLSDLSIKILNFLVPVIIQLIWFLDQLVQIIQVTTAFVGWLAQTLNWLADVGPAAFGRFINGILEKVGGAVNGFITTHAAKMGLDGELGKKMLGGIIRANNAMFSGPGGTNEHLGGGRSGPVQSLPGMPKVPDMRYMLDQNRYRMATGHQFGPPAPHHAAALAKLEGTKLEQIAKDHKPKKGRHGRQHHPHTNNIFQRGAINIEIKNMNNYPPDRIAYDMKKALMDRIQYKTTNTNGGIGGFSATFGGHF
jgi:hypothetical protein